MHVHFVAVAGTGMGALAGLFKAAGHDVSGSDTAFYPPMGPALARWGVRTMEGFDAAHLEPAPDLVVIGNVCRPWNEEAVAAQERGIPYLSMAGALAEHILPSNASLVVAGTHGKTTTSAMCAWLLEHAGSAPGFLIGGLPKNFSESFRLGRQKRALPMSHALGARLPPFVIEGDEYDTAFFDKTPKFWHYRPEIVVLTSIEHDHIDIYPDEAAYLAAFAGLLERMPSDGLLIGNAADAKVVAQVRAHARCPVAWYALEGDDTHDQPPHWLAAPAVSDASGQSFDLYAGGTFAGRAALPQSGEHNLRNALAAIAAASQGFGVPVTTAMAGLAHFAGVARRQDLIGEIAGVRVYDDFAHHPTAVRETLRALSRRHRGGKLWAVYEPRTATACRALHQHAYLEAFDAADRVLFPPLGRDNVPDAERLDLDALVTGLAARGVRAERVASIDAIIARLCDEAAPGDTVALLSNGAFGGIHQRLLDALGAP